ncbi:MAG TPA: hypothetical protein VJ875_11895 [Pyrinomonadaceae bacterium]|nr:hypothetical protein [Pyrinomonadaceae bacterium]
MANPASLLRTDRSLLGWLCVKSELILLSAKGAEYESQGQVLSGAKRVAPGEQQ